MGGPARPHRFHRRRKTDLRNTYQPGAQTGAVLLVPIIVKHVTVAVINLERLEPKVFDDSEVKTIKTLADPLAVAIENISLHDLQSDQSWRLAVVNERDRIDRDLHDGGIQSMYAVGLTLEDIADRAGRSLEAVCP